MARPRTFDEDQALDRAMEVFWKKGYQAASTEDLMTVMGIQRASFYNAFGSKKKTYLRTLDRYLSLLAENGPYKALFESEPGVDALQAMMGQYIESLTGENRAHGCYFVHVAKEHRGEDPEVTRAIQSGIVRMRRILAKHVEAGIAAGILPPALESEQIALLLMSVAWGSHVLIEAGVAKEEVLTSSRIMFDLAALPS
ncbi:MAG: TetR family transcriptional regulator [Candidatus Latescibacteria bacterium]|nr:TetR family transcriptional regulator [Candidatus Latescibacterota bacterium]